MSERRGKGGWSSWSPYPAAPPKLPPPAHGIRVARIGATWWGRRWIEALEKLSWQYSNRLARGRTYARAGRVHDLEIEAGKVTASVTGSRPAPYQVTLRIAVLAARAWDAAIARMAQQAVFAAELLAGQMPQAIDTAFHAAGTSLFPAQENDLEAACSCPDWANPCKHLAAMHYVLGEAFDKDPFLLFELRGRGRESVLGALRRHRAGKTGAAPPAQAISDGSPAVATVALDGTAAKGFERLPGPLPQLRFRIEPPASPGALLRQLG
ncbi:MAG TPA: SWIM zinc finger family protein, partial [Thermoanaerobaculia bacterium]|nr:SWIM zinc finger family protein [Thermoanaerobaculia bacterium]